MDKYPYQVLQKLDSILDSTEKVSWLFSKDPEKDFTRHRKLPFSRLIKLMIGMGGASLNHELLNCFHFDQAVPSVSAFIQQRSKLLPEAMPFVFSQVVEAFPSGSTPDGYRLIACDGSDLHYAANPYDADCCFQTNENSKPYNLLHLNALYDIHSKRYVDAIIQPRKAADEIGAFISMIDRFPAAAYDNNVIFIADRGYESYNVMAHIIEKGCFFLLRIKSPDSNGILSALPLPLGTSFDLNFHIQITKKQTKFVKAHPDIFRFSPSCSRFDFCDLHHDLYYPLDFRVVSVQIAPGVFEYLVTNLDPISFPPRRLKEIYHLRWGIETSFRDLKYTIGLSNFHSKRAEFISQEVFARLILYNLCELVAFHAALFLATSSHVYQLNFSAAVHVFRHTFFLAPDDSPPDVISLIRRYFLPVRPDRVGPRKVKYRSAVPFIYRIA